MILQLCYLSSFVLTKEERSKILLQLDTSKARDPDRKNPRLFKESASNPCYSLYKVFNKSLSTSCFPDPSKMENFIPNQKNKRNTNELTTYRLMSLLSITGKYFLKLCLQFHLWILSEIQYHFWKLIRLLTVNQFNDPTKVIRTTENS